MQWLIYVVLFFIQPLDTAEQEKMAKYMVQKNKRAMFTARPLVKAIYREADRKGLDPTVLAAIVWNESWFYVGTKGSSKERGVWQIWPWASPALDIGWAELRKRKLTAGIRDVPWKSLSLKERWEASMDIDIGTHLAVTIISMLRKYCLRKKHDRKRPTDSYAHYNTGYRYPRSMYSYKLWHRTKRIRRAIGRTEVTLAEDAWMNRMVVTP